MTKGITLILSIPEVYNVKLEINYMMNRLLKKQLIEESKLQVDLMI